MKPYWSDEGCSLYLGKCEDVLPTIPDASVDAVCCDPPYNLPGGFMGSSWDNIGPAREFQAWCEVWARECLRVLKPGGHLLAFGGTSTYHRLAAGIEDAGFEIRESIHWVYGQGFPKGQDVGKLIDKRRNDRADVLRVTAWLAAARDAAGWTCSRMDALFGFNGMGNLWTTQGVAAMAPSLDQWAVLRGAMGFDDAEILPLVRELDSRKGQIGEAWSEREVIGHAHRIRRESDVQLAPVSEGAFDVTAPATVEAARWTGWNTTLKPAHEPIVLARKSTGFNTTVANVLEHGTGALNIDACRTAVADPDYARNAAGDRGHDQNRGRQSDYRITAGHSSDLGRWPTNVVLTHGPECVQTGTRTVRNPSGSVTGDEPSALVDAVYAERKRVPYQARQTETVAVWACQPGCPVAEMDRQSGVGRTNRPASRGAGGQHGAYSPIGAQRDLPYYEDQGGASRFFPVFRFEAKAATSERPRLADGTAHTTVKPLDLMRWLVRLVTPPGGTILDPFAGSGTTGEAAILEGFNAVLIEREQPYADLCVQRLSKPLQPTLFGDAA